MADEEFQDPFTKEAMLDPVLCDDNEVYDRFSVIDLLTKDTYFIGRQRDKVTCIKADFRPFRVMIDSYYPKNKKQRELKRTEFRETIQKEIAQGKSELALKHLLFLKQFDQDHIEGEEHILASQPISDLADLVRTYSQVRPSDEKLHDLTTTAFDLLEKVSEAGYNNSRFALALPYQPSKYTDWTLEAKIAVLLVHCVTTKKQDTILMQESANCEQFIMSDIPVAWKRILLEVFVNQKGCVNQQFLNERMLSSFKEWFRIWSYTSKIPELHEIRMRMYYQVMDNDWVVEAIDFSTFLYMGRNANDDIERGLIRKLLQYTTLRKDIETMKGLVGEDRHEDEEGPSDTELDRNETMPQPQPIAKRPRGRPRKQPAPDSEVDPTPTKRPRGRPRKYHPTSSPVFSPPPTPTPASTPGPEAPNFVPPGTPVYT
jgi:hypothetical protein